MRCNNCGYELEENDMFCPKCGAQIQRNGGMDEIQPREEMYNYDRQQVNSYIDNNQNQNYGSRYEKSSGNIIKTCVIIIIAVVILAAIGIGIYYIVSSIKKSNNYNVKDTSVSESNTMTSTTSETMTTSLNNNDTQTQVATTSTTPNTSTYKVNLKGFKLYIPDDLIYKYDTTKGNIKIGDKIYTWLSTFDIFDVPFQQMKINKSKLSASMTQSLASVNAIISEPTIENIDGVEFVIMEIKIGGTNEILAFAELNSMYSACIEIQTDNNDFDRTVLKNIIPIVKTAEYTGETKNLEMKENIKIEDITKALKKLANDNKSEN